MVQQKSQSECGLTYNSQMQSNSGYSSQCLRSAVNYNCEYQANQAHAMKNTDRAIGQSASANSLQMVKGASIASNIVSQTSAQSLTNRPSVGDDGRASSAGPTSASQDPGTNKPGEDTRANSAGPAVSVNRPRELTLGAVSELAAKSLQDTSTPTPTQFLFPKKVTEEQENFSKGFTQALAQIYQKEGVVPQNLGLFGSDLPIKQEAADNDIMCTDGSLQSLSLSSAATSVPCKNSTQCSTVSNHEAANRQFQQMQNISGQLIVTNNTSNAAYGNRNPCASNMSSTQRFGASNNPHHGFSSGMGYPGYAGNYQQPGMGPQPAHFQSQNYYPGQLEPMSSCAMRPNGQGQGPVGSQMRPAHTMAEGMPMLSGASVRQMRYPQAHSHPVGGWPGEEGAPWLKQEPSVSPPMKTYTPLVTHSVKSESAASGSPLMHSAGGSSCSSSSSSVAVDLDEQERLKLERKRAKNRIAAQRCQMRKIEKINRLEDKVARLHEQNSNLSQTVEALNEHIAELRRQINAHASRGCRLLLPAMNPPSGPM